MSFYNDLTPIEQHQFDSYINDLCEEGVFRKEQDGSEPLYRITAAGEDLIWTE